MLSRLMRLLIVSLLATGAMAGMATIPTGINLGSAQDGSPVPDDCQAEQMELPGYRDMRPGEVAYSMPPIRDLPNCTDPLTFYREFQMQEGDEPVVGLFPDGRIGFHVLSGSFKMTLSEGSGQVIHCEEAQEGEPCTPEEIVLNQVYDIPEGDSFFVSDPDGEGDVPLQFTVEFSEGSQTSGGGMRSLLTHNGNHANVGGATNVSGGYSTMGCNSGGCY